MTPDRRTLIKGLGLLPLATMPVAGGLKARGAPAGALRFVADERLPGARALAVAARRAGHEVGDPQGEIVAHVLRQGPDWLTARGPIIGLTSYTDMMLMRDLARGAGRPMRYASAAQGKARPLIDRLDGCEAAFLAAIARAPSRAGQAGAFLWLV
ncbi:MAG: hypothetical protein J0I80_07220 [Sphingomonas sp.]|nr:hypothetical protein [Sphingomonas sp.]